MDIVNGTQRDNYGQWKMGRSIGAPSIAWEDFVTKSNRQAALNEEFSGMAGIPSMKVTPDRNSEINLE